MCRGQGDRLLPPNQNSLTAVRAQDPGSLRPVTLPSGSDGLASWHLLRRQKQDPWKPWPPYWHTGSCFNIGSSCGHLLGSGFRHFREAIDDSEEFYWREMGASTRLCPYGAAVDGLAAGDRARPFRVPKLPSFFFFPITAGGMMAKIQQSRVGSWLIPAAPLCAFARVYL